MSMTNEAEHASQSLAAGRPALAAAAMVHAAYMVLHRFVHLFHLPVRDWYSPGRYIRSERMAPQP